MHSFQCKSRTLSELKSAAYQLDLNKVVSEKARSLFFGKDPTDWTDASAMGWFMSQNEPVSWTIYFVSGAGQSRSSKEQIQKVQNALVKVFSRIPSRIFKMKQDDFPRIRCVDDGRLNHKKGKLSSLPNYLAYLGVLERASEDNDNARQVAYQKMTPTLVLHLDSDLFWVLATDAKGRILQLFQKNKDVQNYLSKLRMYNKSKKRNKMGQNDYLKVISHLLGCLNFIIMDVWADDLVEENIVPKKKVFLEGNFQHFLFGLLSRQNQIFHEKNILIQDPSKSVERAVEYGFICTLSKYIQIDQEVARIRQDSLQHDRCSKTDFIFNGQRVATESGRGTISMGTIQQIDDDYQLVLVRWDDADVKHRCQLQEQMPVEEALGKCSIVGVFQHPI